MFKCHVGCLPASTTTEELTAFFEKYGSIKQVKVLKKSRKLCSGNAVLQCADEATLQRIVKIKSFEFGGRTIFCELQLSGAELEQKKLELSQRRVFLSNIPPQMEDDDIGKLLSTFGPVENSYRIKSLKEAKRPFGFVTFYDSISARNAVNTRKVHFGEVKITISDFKVDNSPTEKIQKTSKNPKNKEESNKNLVSKEKKTQPTDPVKTTDSLKLSDPVTSQFDTIHSLKPTRNAYFKELSNRVGKIDKMDSIERPVPEYRFNINMNPVLCTRQRVQLLPN